MLLICENSRMLCINCKQRLDGAQTVSATQKYSTEKVDGWDTSAEIILP